VSGFVIRRVRTGPDELRVCLPIFGCTRDQHAGPNGTGDFIYASLNTPVKHRFAGGFATARRQPERLDHDEHGTFLWVSDVVMRAHVPGVRPYFGMRDFAVDLAYVVDPSLREDGVFDATKVEFVGVVEIDATEDAHWPRSSAAPDAAPAEPAPRLKPVGEFEQRVDDIAAALAVLAGQQVGNHIAVPKQIGPHDEPPEGIPSYRIGDVLRYHTLDPISGWMWRETTDPEELLYWIADDIAAGIAWRWAQRAPASGTMRRQDALWNLAMPYWRLLMRGLRMDWGNRMTRERYETFTQATPRFLGVPGIPAGVLGNGDASTNGVPIHSSTSRPPR